MDKISKTTPFGNTFLSYQTYTNNGKGLKMVKPTDGFYLVLDHSDGKLYEAYHYDKGVIAPKNSIFKRVENKIFTVYFISEKEITIKSFTKVAGRDVEYENVSTDFNVIYEITLKVAIGRGEQLIVFIKKYNLPSPIEDVKLKDILQPEFDLVIKSVIGKHLKTQTVAEITVLQAEISNEILKTLNSQSANLYDNGFIVEKIAFAVSEDYMHREEKKRVEHNRVLR